jgi:hypothetical protein
MYDTKVHDQKEQRKECFKDEKLAVGFWPEWKDRRRQHTCSIPHFSLKSRIKLSSGKSSIKITGQSPHDLIIIYASYFESYRT